ncbi:MAG TPA: M13 family metallopeptidase, partial [Candidatus Cybelea sp.]
MRNSASWSIRVAAVAALAALAFGNAHVSAAVGLKSGIDVANLDRSCKPCDDFFQFVNGGWIAKNPIPAAYPSWGNFNLLRDRNEAVLRQVAEAAAKSGAASGTNEQKVGDFYASCMNAAAIQAAGVVPIQPLLDLAANASPANLGTTLARLQAAGVNVFFRFAASPDRKNSAQNIAFVGQGGLGLPDRDYYTRTDPKSTAIVAAYRAHVAAMFQLLGDPAADAATEAASVFSTEEALAKAQLTIVQRRDPQATYHKMTLTDAQALAPRVALAEYVASAGADAAAPLNVAEPAYVQALNAELGTLSPQGLHAYLRWHVVNAYATALPTAFADEHWNFFSKTLRGSQAQLPRWQRCVQSTDDNLGEALGQMYVRKAFPPAAKAAALEMVQNIKSELRDDFSTLSWMSPQTRALAVKKLDAFLLKIGYPDKWRDYGALAIVQGPYAANVLAAARFDTAYENAKIGKPVDRTEWGMTTPTVNAYYNPSINEIVFPAGILQPPFFNANADPAVNYGAIGAVVGHESTHGFDDEGRKYDAQGNLTDW